MLLLEKKVQPEELLAKTQTKSLVTKEPQAQKQDSQAQHTRSSKPTTRLASHPRNVVKPRRVTRRADRDAHLVAPSTTSNRPQKHQTQLTPSPEHVRAKQQSRRPTAEAVGHTPETPSRRHIPTSTICHVPAGRPCASESQSAQADANETQANGEQGLVSRDPTTIKMPAGVSAPLVEAEKSATDGQA